MSNTAPVVSCTLTCVGTSRARVSISSARCELAELHEDLTECRQRDGQSLARPERLVEGHAALGQRQRFLMAVAHQGDVRLIVEHERQGVVGLDRRGQPLGLAQRRQRFLRPA